MNQPTIKLNINYYAPRIAYAALRGIIEWLPSWEACPESIKTCLDDIIDYIVTNTNCAPIELIKLLREHGLDSVADIPIVYDAMRALRSIVLEMSIIDIGH